MPPPLMHYNVSPRQGRRSHTLLLCAEFPFPSGFVNRPALHRQAMLVHFHRAILSANLGPAISFDRLQPWKASVEIAAPVSQPSLIEHGDD